MSFWSSLSSPQALTTYFSSAYTGFTANGQLPTTDWDCSFGEPNWTTCLTANMATPIILSLMWGMMGLIVQASQHWGFYATIGARETDDSF